MRLSVIVASNGRPTLARTLQSIQPQLDDHDEILVSVNSDAPAGHRARNQLAPAARGDMLLWLDDDDVYVPNALEIVCGRVGEDTDSIHIFRMRYPDDRVLWHNPDIGEAPGNVSTAMFCVPRAVAVRAEWTEVYEGDFYFIKAAAERAPVVWHEDVIALVRPDG